MKTDSYTLAIPEDELRTAAMTAMQSCHHKTESHLKHCASEAVRHLICPCLHGAPCVIDALVDEFCASIERNQHKSDHPPAAAPQL